METNTEHDRAFTRMDLGIYVHEAENVKRKHSRAAECAKMGLNILLFLAIACLIAGTWISSWFFTPAVVIGMIYVLCLIITPNESDNEN